MSGQGGRRAAETPPIRAEQAEDHVHSLGPIDPEAARTEGKGAPARPQTAAQAKVRKRLTPSEHITLLRTEQREIKAELAVTPWWRWRKRRALYADIDTLSNEVKLIKFFHFNHLYGSGQRQITERIIRPR